MHKFGFFTKSSVEADVGELVAVSSKQSASTNALAQCLAVEVSDSTGKRTLTHISPYADDNPMKTDNPELIALHWVGEIRAEHNNNASMKAIILGGRKGDAASEGL